MNKKNLKISPAKTEVCKADEVNKYLIEAVHKKVKQISDAENRYAVEFGILKSTIVTDIQLFIPSFCSSALHDNIDNLAAIFNNNTVAGLFSTYKAAGLEKELEKEKKAREILLAFIRTVGMKELFRNYIKNNYTSSN